MVPSGESALLTWCRRGPTGPTCTRRQFPGLVSHYCCSPSTRRQSTRACPDALLEVLQYVPLAIGSVGVVIAVLPWSAVAVFVLMVLSGLAVRAAAPKQRAGRDA